MFNVISVLHVDQIEYSHFSKICSCKISCTAENQSLYCPVCDLFSSRQVDVERRNVLTHLLDISALSVV